jgi:vacuolar-type H+-ATPase subunit C/Vma6
MQFILNNTLFLVIKKALNKALYRFVINNITDLLSAKLLKR